MRGPQVLREWSKWPALLALATACGETKELELFPKNAPEPAPKPAELCGNVECPRERRVCVADQCVECETDPDCGATKPACVQNTCVACRVDEHCPAEKVCQAVAHRCTEPCLEHAQCTDKSRKVCDAERGWCVPCLLTADCAENQVCDLTINSCVDCTMDDDCGDASICDERHECVSGSK